ncbi:MAG TPA: hypothetical protein PK351_06050 [Spirochaetota bacterium]|nr:hypothetical protein [Spirochaetota bacterium]
MKKLMLFLIFVSMDISLFSFDGLTDQDDSHIEITKSSLSSVFGVDYGEVIKRKEDIITGVITFELKKTKISDIIAFASRDIDLYLFGFLPSHAQTDKYDYNREYSIDELKKIETMAVFRYLKFINSYYKKIDEAYYNNEIVKGAYYLGFIIHSIEDLFAHYGMTNEQHRYLDKKSKSPDYDIENIKLCRIKMEIFFKKFENLFSDKGRDNFLNSIKKNEVINEDINSLGKKILKKSKDILWEGLKYLLFTSYNEKCMKYFENIKWDYEKIFEIILDRNLMNEIDSIDNIDYFSIFLKKVNYQF